MRLPTGLHRGVSHEDYHADPSELPSLSAHMASLVLRSPAHARLGHPRFGGKIKHEQDDAMDTGTLLHGMLLGGGPEIVAIDADSWRKDATKAKRDDALAAGKLPILAHKLEVVQAVAEGIRGELLAIGHDYADASCEVTALWTSGGCPCRARIDALFGGCDIDDFKSTQDALAASDSGNIVRNGYHVQAAAYVDAIETLKPALAGRVTFSLTFAETARPYGVIRVEVAGSMLELGRRRWNRAKAVWAECLRTDKWPGYPREVQRPEAPQWALMQDMEEQMTKIEGGSQDV